MSHAKRVRIATFMAHNLRTQWKPVSDFPPLSSSAARTSASRLCLTRFIGQRRSIVGDEPGITRDRIYGEATYRGRRFELIDTGGIITNDEELIPTQILKQARVALEDALSIIFLIDGRTRNHRRRSRPGRDAAQARQAGRSGREQDRQREARGELAARISFARLRAHVSRLGRASPRPRRTAGARHADDFARRQPSRVLKHEPKQQRSLKIKIAIIGRPNVGKSTLLNALTGTERAIVSPVAGTTRDAVDETIHHNGIDYVFVDTAGIRRKGKTKLMAEKLSVVMARRHLRMSHVAMLVMDATEGVLALDATIAGYAHEEGRAVILCVNKWDAVETPEQAQVHGTDPRPA